MLHLLNGNWLPDEWKNLTLITFWISPQFVKKKWGWSEVMGTHKQDMGKTIIELMKEVNI